MAFSTPTSKKNKKKKIHAERSLHSIDAPFAGPVVRRSRSSFQDPSPESAALRAKAMPLNADDPTRVPDHILSGPDLPEANTGLPQQGDLERMARKRYQDPTPQRRGDWWTLRFRQDEVVNGKLKRIRKEVRLALIANTRETLPDWPRSIYAR